MKTRFQSAYEKLMMAWTMGEAGDYRELARAIHPDLNGSDPRSGEAMTKLQVLNSPIVDRGIGGIKIEAGDIAEIFLLKDGPEVFKDYPLMLKRALSPGDNDLLDIETERLTALKRTSFVPKLVDSRKVDGKASNLIQYIPRNLAVPLEYMGAGTDFRHVVWMAHRVMAALAETHNKGFVHGAILPRHLLFIKRHHGLAIVDWCYSVKIGEKLKAIVTGQEQYYPKEVKRKGKVGPDFDIYMAAKSLEGIAEVPKKFRPWFEKATMGQPRSRWQNAWDAYDSITRIAEEVYGPPRFVEWLD